MQQSKGEQKHTHRDAQTQTQETAHGQHDLACVWGLHETKYRQSCPNVKGVASRLWSIANLSVVSLLVIASANPSRLISSPNDALAFRRVEDFWGE